MRFTLRDRFDAPVARVESATLDPDYQARLTDLPNVSEREVLSQDERDDGTVHRVVRYRFGGNLPGAVQAAIGSTVSWDEVGVFWPDRHEWTFEIRPHVAKDKLTCQGSYRFVPDGEGSVREVEVDLKVRVPFVGGRVEKAIRDGLVESMEAEARALSDYLEENDR